MSNIYRPFVGNEKQVVKRNMLAMMKRSKEEYDMWVGGKRREIIFLQQASEKLFNVVELYISYKTSSRIYAHQAIYSLEKNKSLIEIFEKAELLHRFFYNAENGSTIARAEEIYLYVYDQMKRRVYSIQ